MDGDALAEEGIDPTPGAVDELVGNKEVARLEAFLETADRVDGDDALHAERLKGVDIGAEGNIGGGNAVPAPVPGQEGNADSLQVADDDFIAGLAEGGPQADFLDITDALNLIQPAPPDDGDFSCGHEGYLHMESEDRPCSQKSFYGEDGVMSNTPSRHIRFAQYKPELIRTILASTISKKGNESKLNECDLFLMLCKCFM